jgi:ABC-type transport system involved in multi-copper enzyme maturation permease subunit
LVLIIGFYLASSAGSTIAGQIEKRTADFTFSQPISRVRFVLSDIIVTNILAILSTLILTVVLQLSASEYAQAYHFSNLFAFFINACCIGLAVYGIALLLSSFLRSKIAVSAFSAIIIVASYLLTTLSGAVDILKDYNIYSLFHYYNPVKLLSTGQLEASNIIVLLTIFIVTCFSALIIFDKKDI